MINNREMTIEKVIQTLIGDYSKQAKLSKRERTIFKHGLLTGIEIGPIEESEVDLEKEIKRFTMSKELYEADSAIKAVAEHFFKLGLKAQKGE